MAEGGLMVIDGTQLRDADLSSIDSAVTGARLLEVAESVATSSLFGISLPESVKSAAVLRIDDGTGSFRSTKFDMGEALEKLREYLNALSDLLKDDPLVISVLDGHALHLFLDDEDDFAMLAENLFTDLDTDDNGKLSKNEVRSALVHMGVGMGVPPFSESHDLLTNILKKHGAEGMEELGQAQFAQLLQAILQDLADALAKNHVIVIQNVKVINGSKLRKVLNDEKLFNDAIEKMYQDWVAYKNDEGNTEMLRVFLEEKGLELGLPPSESNEAVVILYNQIFSGVNKEKIDSVLEKDAFREVVRDLLEKFAEQLEANPIILDLES